MRNEERHPPEPWSFVERGITIDRLPQSESLFALANGHIGLRGNLDEGEPVGTHGTYLNGFYESYPLQYGEREQRLALRQAVDRDAALDETTAVFSPAARAASTKRTEPS